MACGQDVKSCTRLTNSEKVGAKYVSGKFLRDEYWYLGWGWVYERIEGIQYNLFGKSQIIQNLDIIAFSIFRIIPENL